MSRFDCPEYVEAWQASGSFPAIHDGIFSLLSNILPDLDGSVLDLGSSTGLLSRRMADAGYTVYAIEGSVATSNVGRNAGIYSGIEVLRARLKPRDMGSFAEWLSKRDIKVVMARRVFPELDDYGCHPSFLAQVFAEAGVEHIFVEGRLPRPNATHRLQTLHDEIAALGPLWEVDRQDGPHRAHLVRSERGVADL
jgi:hypothetical protein